MYSSRRLYALHRSIVVVDESRNGPVSNVTVAPRGVTVHVRATDHPPSQMLSQDLGAIEREAAVSESSENSETDEEAHPLRLKPQRNLKPTDQPSAAAAAHALAKHGAATIATPVVSPRVAALARRGCTVLRDDARTHPGTRTSPDKP